MNPAPDQPVRTTSGKPRTGEIAAEHRADPTADADLSAAENERAIAARLHEEAVDDAVEMTFPASDPPAWMSSGTPPAHPS